MNRQLQLFALLLGLVAAVIPRFALRADTCDSVVCGDIDGDGTYNISDYVYITQFLFGGGPAPAPCGDIDGYDLITIRDLLLGASMQPASCVTQPKIVAQPPYTMTVWYQRLLSQNQGFSTFSLRFMHTGIQKIRAFALPLSVRVDGQIPLSISVDLSASTWPDQDISASIDTSAGTIFLSDLDGSVSYGLFTLCNITIEMPQSADTNYTSITYTELGPYMTGVLDPTISACHYPMFLDLNLNAWKPDLRNDECLCGDANNSRFYSISDAVHIISHTFAGGPPPGIPCLGDANGSGGISISDAVYLISYIFGGGAEPHCP